MKTHKTKLALATTAVFAASAALAPAAFAADSPFGMQKLDSGYQLAQADKKAGSMGGDKKPADKKAEGACGGDKKADGSCGASKKAADIKVADKKKDGKCGEGKCGSTK